jgi:hypothetical protein
MARIIKQVETPVKIFKVGDHISFSVWVPLQNIGTTSETRMANIVKVNRKTVDAVDGSGNTWRVEMEEIH